MFSDIIFIIDHMGKTPFVTFLSCMPFSQTIWVHFLDAFWCLQLHISSMKIHQNISGGNIRLLVPMAVLGHLAIF